MKSFLFTNVFFEEELMNKTSLTPIELLQKHPLYFQLQYLSFLTNTSSETPLVSQAPPSQYLSYLESLGLSSSFALFSDFPLSEASLHTWGPSKSLSTWASQNNCSYQIPDLEIVKKVQSKQFSFEECPKLPCSKLIQNLEELNVWWNSFKGLKVLKTLFGSSGRGHFIGSDADLSKAAIFFQKQGNAVIAQPWVERILDFSTQWKIENRSFSYMGATICENSSKGTYQKSVVGPEKILFHERIDFFNEHLIHAKITLQKLISLNFHGNVGFDAFLYKNLETQQMQLFPIVEINARKTMGWVALRLYEKLSCQKILSLSYSPSTENPLGLLPSSSTSFSRQLCINYTSEDAFINEFNKKV